MNLKYLDFFLGPSVYQLLCEALYEHGVEAYGSPAPGERSDISPIEAAKSVETLLLYPVTISN